MLLIYPLVVMGGLYAGVQTYAHFGTAEHRSPAHAASFEPASVPTSRSRPGVRHDRSRRGHEEAPPDAADDQTPPPVQGDTHLVPSETDPTPPDPALVAPPDAGIPSGARDEVRDDAPSVRIDPAALPAVQPLPAPPSSGPVQPRAASRVSAPGNFAAVPAVEIDRAATGRREVALTFDAGADVKPARQILDELASEHVKSTFFLTGEWATRNSRTTRRIGGEGHEIGNHSWNHLAFTRLSDEEIADQLRRTDAAIQEASGLSSRPYFRPPLGARDRRVIKTVGDQGFFTIYWTLDSLDSVKQGITAEEIRDRVLAKAAPGAIVLMHCGSQASADALPEIIRGLRARGLTPVTVSQLLAR